MMRPVPAAGHGSAVAGFTLFELLVVLAILTALTALSVPLFSGRTGMTELRGTARDMAAALRFAHSEAISRNKAVEFRMDPESREFAVTGDPRVRRVPDGIRVSMKRPDTAGAPAEIGVVRFFPDGSSNGAEIMLESDKARYHIGVEWLTGRVRLSDPDADD